MTRPEDTVTDGAPSGIFLGLAVAAVLSVPIYGVVAVLWLLSQPLAWWLVS